MDGAEFYTNAFWQLTTCRGIGFGEGPIPWTAVVQWAQIKDLGPEEFEELETVILAMDRVYLKYRSDQAKKS
jgi:hypothetical protein